MLSEGLTDTLAQIVYPVTFVTCMTWAGIFLSHMLRGSRVLYGLRAGTAFFSGVAFGLLSFSA